MTMLDTNYRRATRRHRAMLFTLLANSRAPAPRMMCEGKVAQYPAPELSPTDVVASQISALQAADSAPTQLNQKPAQV